MALLRGCSVFFALLLTGFALCACGGGGGSTAAPRPVLQPYVLAVPTLYVANRGVSSFGSGSSIAASILEFPITANGNVLPAVTISGNRTQLTGPSAIAVDPSGNIYVVNEGANAAVPVLIFAPGSSGNVAPAAMLSGSNTQIEQPLGIAIDHDGLIYVSQVFPTAKIAVFAAGSTGNTSPLRVISGLTTPTAMAFDANNNLYLGTSGNIVEFAAGANGNAAPIATINVNSDSSAAIDSAGRIITGSPSPCGPGIQIFAAGANGNAAPVQTMNPAIPCTSAFVVDSANNIYALSGSADPALQGISVFPSTASGNTAPARQINVPATILNGASSIAIR